MLVLSRTKGQKIIVGDGSIEFQILEIRGDIVKIGINAPREVAVHRQEVFESILVHGEIRTQGGETPSSDEKMERATEDQEPSSSLL